MADIEASFPTGTNDERVRIPIRSRATITDIASDSQIVVSIGDSSVVRQLSDNFRRYHAITFRSFSEDSVKRNGRSVGITSISGEGVRFQTSIAQGENLPV